MPIISLEELDEILKHYANESPFISDDNNRPICTITPHIVKCHGNELARANEFGAQASVFIKQSSEHYKNGHFSPPLSEQKIRFIYELLEPLNKDLQGDSQGNPQEQQRAKEWETYWQKVIADFKSEGRDLTKEEISSAQFDILKTYRYKIILQCNFKAQTDRALDIDEIRIQEYLVTINNYLSLYTPQEAYHHLFEKLMQDFEKDLGLDLQTLSRYLNINQQQEYLKKFEEIMSRKTVEFIGTPAILKLFTEITKDKEFLRQLPSLVKKGKSLQTFLLHFPDIEKRDKLLSACMITSWQNGASV